MFLSLRPVDSVDWLLTSQWPAFVGRCPRFVGRCPRFSGESPRFSRASAGVGCPMTPGRLPVAWPLMASHGPSCGGGGDRRGMVGAYESSLTGPEDCRPVSGSCLCLPTESGVRLEGVEARSLRSTTAVSGLLAGGSCLGRGCLSSWAGLPKGGRLGRSWPEALRAGQPGWGWAGLPPRPG